MSGFTIEYDTNIPRQVGLAGSSAIVTAAIHALMDFYGVTDEDIPKHAQPHLMLSAETEELEIQAGLQGRVVQVYGGAVYVEDGGGGSIQGALRADSGTNLGLSA